MIFIPKCKNTFFKFSNPLNLNLPYKRGSKYLHFIEGLGD